MTDQEERESIQPAEEARDINPREHPDAEENWDQDLEELEEELDPELEYIEKLDLNELKYELSRELGDEYDGYDEEGEKPKRIPPKFELRVSDDRMEAHLKVIYPGKPRAISIDVIQEYLKDKGVTKGILEENIEKILDEDIIDQEILIAKGKKPDKGRDARIELLIDSAKNPEDCVNDRGRVDFKQMRLKNVVEEGEVVAELIPATAGTPGYKVTGEELKAKPGKTKEFSASSDVEVSKDGRKLIALKNGVLLRDFSIKDINIIESDVSYSTGNITYPKSLVIKGDVKSGFSVKCGENIEIARCVEDATVMARGDVIVKEGFMGKGKGFIRGRNVTIGHVKQQRVMAEDEIDIGGEVLYGRLHAGGLVKVIGVKGIVIGGEIIAGHGIELVNAGNKQNIKTHLCAGYNREIMVLDNNLEKIKGYLQKVKESIRVYKNAGPLEKLSKTKKKLLQNLIKTQLRLEKQLDQIQDKRLEEIGRLLKEQKPYIKVNGTVFRNCTIQIGDQKRYIDKQMRNKIFIRHKDKILDMAASTLSRTDIEQKSKNNA